MERISSSTQEVTRSVSNRAHNWYNRMQSMLQNVIDTVRVYVNRYPPLAAFLFTVLIFSAIPISLYILFAAFTISITLSIAIIGFAVVEGTMLLVGAGILLTVLSGITAITGIGFSWLFGIWMAYRGGCLLLSKFGNSASSLSDVVTGQVKSVTQSASERLQQLQQSAQEQVQKAHQATSGRWGLWLIFSCTTLILTTNGCEDKYSRFCFF